MILNQLVDFINRNYIDGIINDTSYNHVDMLTYIIVLFAGVYAVLKILNKLKIKVDEEFVLATIPYIFMGSVFRVIEDADILNPPASYILITPLIYFLVFAVCFGILLSTKYLESIKKIHNHLQIYAGAGLLIALAGILIIVYYSHNSLKPDLLLYVLVPAIALTIFIRKISPAIKMEYLQSRAYSFTIFSFLLASITTYTAVDLLGYTNKHPFSSFIPSIFGTGIVMIPLSLILALLIVLMLEKDSKNDSNDNEKYILVLTSIVLGFSMGARNLIAMVFGV